MSIRLLHSDCDDLDRIRVRFATFREASAADRIATASRLRETVTHERIVLDTCHRVELLSVDDAPVGGASAVGRDAIHRAFFVIAGFDSAVVAEEQLLGQARRAYESALADGSTGPILNELLRRAIRFGRRVRSHARPGTDRSLADRGAGWLLERLGPTSSDAVVAGTGEMGRLIATRLAEAGHVITVVSASAERGDRMVRQLRGRSHRAIVGQIDPATIANASAVSLALRPRGAVLTASHLTGAARPWVLDLSTPPAVAPDAASHLGHRLVGVDQLGGLESMTPVFEPGVERRLHAELESEVEAFVAWLAARGSRDAIAVLHGDADAIRRRHLDRLRRCGSLAPDQLAMVEATVSGIVGELLHRPSVELRRGGTHAATVRRLYGLDR